MTREKYESLPLATLKELAKARKMKGVSTLKKADLIEAMISLDEQEDQEKLSEQKESSQEHLKEMQNQNREEKAASELKENKEHRAKGLVDLADETRQIWNSLTADAR